MKSKLLCILLLFAAFGSVQAQAPCPTRVTLGTASNVYTAITNESNQIVANNDLNSLLYIHRQNTTIHGGHSGNLRYDYSTNGGSTWTIDQGPLNPASVNGTNAARYPQIGLYNPTGNTTFTSAWLVYQAPTVGTTWNGVVTGVRKLDGTGNTENYNQAGATQTLIPRSMVERVPGEYWSVDAVYNGTIQNGFTVHKGVWNGSTDVVWSVDTTLVPSYNLGYDGNPYTADYNIAFSPDGQHGWICAQTHVTGGPTDFAFYPVFYHSDDGGQTWSGPEQVDIGQWSHITSNIQTGNVPTTAFDMDLTVDINGNPHALMAIGNGANTYSIYFGEWHAMFDITKEHGVWNPIMLDTLRAGRATWGTAPNQVSQDALPQISRTADGSKIFFTWTDSPVTLGAANDSPDLFVKAFDVVNGTWTTTRNVTSCNALFTGKIQFPHTAPEVLGLTSSYELPVVYAEMTNGNDPLSVTNFYYLDNVLISDADFVVAHCVLPVSISPNDTVTLCQGNFLSLDAGSGEVYAWSDGSTQQTATWTLPGMVWVGVSTAGCAGGDSLFIVHDSLPAAAFSSSGSTFTFNFTDMSTGDPSGWLWDFGDGNTSTQQNPTHTYSSVGSYTVCLTVTDSCGTDSSCQTVTASCPPTTADFSFSVGGLAVTFTDLTSGSVTAWNWDFGDGNSSTNQNPTHIYGAAGTYYVCLTITDSCGSNTFCDSVTALCPVPVADFGWLQSGTGPTVDFTDNSNPAPSAWSWDFGDGNLSTLQNPTHTYANVSGTYWVCLTVTNSCGTDSICDSVTVTIVGIEPQWASGVHIWPNPAQDEVRLSFEAMPGNPHIELRDVTGRILREIDLRSAGHTTKVIDLRDFANGMYFLHIRYADEVLIRKVVKE